MRNNPMNLCFKCAELYEGHQCNFCGAEHPDNYDAMLEYSKQVYEMGVNYRNFFEEKVASEGKIRCFASLIQPEQWLVFIGIAALSGVIGNASYDLVKSVIKKIVEKAKQDGAEKIVKQFDLDAKIEIVIIQIHEYINTPEKIHPEVLRGIKEEERVDDYMYGFIEKMEVMSNKKNTPDIIKQELKLIETRKLKIKSVNSKNFLYFWDKYQK